MIKNFVEQLRRRRGVSKSHLARQICVCPSYINRLENQEITPSVEVMFRIAEYFKCKVEDVLEHRPDKGRC
jgi:DNA-binding XRE family transcriptional regulator